MYHAAHPSIPNLIRAIVIAPLSTRNLGFTRILKYQVSTQNHTDKEKHGGVVWETTTCKRICLPFLGRQEPQVAMVSVFPTVGF